MYRYGYDIFANPYSINVKCLANDMVTNCQVYYRVY